MRNAESPPKTASPEVADFLCAVRAYLAKAQPPLTEKSLSSIVFGDGKQIGRLTAGCDITTGRLRSAWERLRDLEAGGSRSRKTQTSKEA